MYTSSRSWVVGYACDCDIWNSHQCAEGDELYSRVVVIPKERRRGKVIIYLEWCFVPNDSVCSFDVVPGFPSMLFSDPCTTSSHLRFLFRHLYLVVWHILFIVSVLGGELSAHCCNSRCLSCLEVTRALGENGRNFKYKVGATKPMGIILPPRSHKSTQLCCFDILPPSRKSIQLCGFGIFYCFCCGPWNGSPPFLSVSPPTQSFPSVFGRVVYPHWMSGIPLIH